MKILIICNCATGLETFRGMLIQKLVKERNVVSAIVPQTDEKKEIEAEDRIKRMQCDLIRIPMERRGKNPIHDLRLMFGYYRTVKKMKPNMVITYTIKPNIYGGLVCRLLKIPYVANITGLGTAFQNTGILCRAVTMMYKVALKKAKIVFFENTQNRDVIVNSKIISKQKTYVLAGAGVNLEYFQYLKYPKDNGKIRFLFIGRIMQEKGINELFLAMRRLRKAGYDCDLDVLGGFEENYIDIINQYEKEGWLHYRGYKEDVRPYIEVAHCFVLPSWHEGMANTNLENAASGRPLITTDIYGCKEAVIDGVSGFLVKKNNADDLYDKMLRFIQLTFEQKREMGVAGRKLMEEKFDKRNVVQETMDRIYS